MRLIRNTAWRVDPPSETHDGLEDLEAWRATAICGCLLVLTPLLLLVPWRLASWLVGSNPIAQPIVAGAIGTAAAIATLSIVARRLDVPSRAIFLRGPSRQTARWAAVGTGLVLAVAMLTAVLTEGSVRFDRPAAGRIVAALVAGCAIGVWTGTVEELVFRGGVLSILGHQWNWGRAVLATAALFGAIHNGYASSTPGTLTYIALTGTAGLLLALVAVRTGNVWNAVAIHASWNALLSDYVVSIGSAPAGSPLIEYQPADGSWFVVSQYWEPIGSPLALAVFALAGCAYALIPCDNHACNRD